MSQVKFKTEHKGKPVEVMAGWDHPLQGFFLTVFDLDPNADVECVYSDLDDHQLISNAVPNCMGHTDTTEYFRSVLKDMGIGVPEEFWARVELRERNVLHEFDGENWQRIG
jgi:hypothetical protein